MERKIDSKRLLSYIKFKVPTHSTRNFSPLFVPPSTTNYGAFCPMSAMCKLYNNNYKYLTNLNIKSKKFKYNFMYI